MATTVLSYTNIRLLGEEISGVIAAFRVQLCYNIPLQLRQEMLARCLIHQNRLLAIHLGRYRYSLE